MSPMRVLFSKLRPQPTDAAGARFRHPAEAGAEEGVFLFAAQREAEGFGVEGAEFFGELHSLGVAFGEDSALTFGDSDFVERGDGVPADVALWVERPIRRDEDHRAVGREVDGEFEQERFVVLHPVEIPAEAKGVECGAEGVGFAAEVHAENRAHIALCVHRAADDALVVAVRGDIELGLDALPLAVQHGVGAGGEFGL